MSRMLICLLLSLGFFASPGIFAQDSSTLVSAQASLLSEKGQPVIFDSGFYSSHSINGAAAPVPEILSATSRTAMASNPLSFRSIAIPSAMIAYGVYAFSNRELKKWNLAVRDEVWEDRSKKKPVHVDNFTTMVPAAAVYVLNLAGVKGKNNFVDRSVLYGMSLLIGGGVVTSVKRLSGVIRPDSTNRYSFPSGHTAEAFISAEFMRQEYKDVSPWYGVAGYAVAVGTGFLRMYNNKHWFNDVVAGAGVGILSTRLSYWLYPKIKNTFVKGKENNTVVMPMYQNGAIGFGLVHTFR